MECEKTDCKNCENFKPKEEEGPEVFIRNFSADFEKGAKETGVTTTKCMKEVNAWKKSHTDYEIINMQEDQRTISSTKCQYSIVVFYIVKPEEEIVEIEIVPDKVGVEFFTRCTRGESIREPTLICIDKANKWLSKNPEYEVVSMSTELGDYIGGERVLVTVFYIDNTAAPDSE